LEIVGVVKNFHFQDLHLPISPYGFTLRSRPDYNYLLVHTKTNNFASFLAELTRVWQKLNPTEPFEYNFLDEEFQKNYQAQDRLAAIVKYFTIIAILISCLGLFGLATFSAEQRTKEIGIRKVLGASVSNLVLLISRDFIKLVLIAIILASPLAWWIMKMVTGFCISYRYRLGGVCTISFHSLYHCLYYCEYTGGQGSGIESCKKFAEQSNLF
jgi:putative ABC transport system permease protein